MRLREAGDKVLDRLQAAEPTWTFDPNIILVIIEAIRILMPMFIELCAKSIHEIPETCRTTQDPATLGERIAWRMARRSLIRGLSYEDYQAAGGDKMLRAILMEGAVSSTEDLTELWYSMFVLGDSR